MKLFHLIAFAATSLTAADFAADVFPVLQKADCAACHKHNGVASGTRLKFPEAPASPAAINAFGRSLSVLVDRETPENSLLVRKPTGAIPHAGGKRIAPGSPDEAKLREWVQYLATASLPAEPTVVAEEHKPVGPVLRRLTHEQYNNTVRDLLGDDSRIADQFPPEDFVNGFRNQYQAQSTSPLQAEAYAMAAEKLSKKAFAGDDISHLVRCKTTNPACRSQFIRDFGQKAFRRPLTVKEVQRYEQLFAAGKDFRDGARTIVEAMLQSPNFLLRTENGLRQEWRAYETASRLSYFIWNTMPDQALLKSAEAGDLNTPEGTERVVRRMLKDPRARESMNNFITEWLRFDRLASTVKDRRAFPQFTPEMTFAMAEETRRLFNELVWNNRNFMELYSADYGFVNADLAKLYGVPLPAQDFQKVAFPATTERAGVLGHGTFLAVTSNPLDSSPTARGLFVREQFLCQEVPQPPPGVSTNLPAPRKEKPETTRERLAIHLLNESCRSCHQLIDPIGFGFEKFDAIGQHRNKQKVVFRAARGEKETPPVTVELDLDTSGHVAGIRDSVFSNPRELGKILAASEQCQECVVKQLFRYAAGRHETAADRIVIRKAYEDFKRTEFLFQELLVSLSKWMIHPPGGIDGSGVH